MLAGGFLAPVQGEAPVGHKQQSLWVGGTCAHMPTSYDMEATSSKDDEGGTVCQVV